MSAACVPLRCAYGGVCGVVEMLVVFCSELEGGAGGRVWLQGRGMRYF